MWLRGLAPPLRYATYIAVVFVALFAAAGVGAAAALVVEWQSERAATGSGGPTGSGKPEGTAAEMTAGAPASQGTATEPTNGAEDSVASGTSYVHRATDGNSRGDYTILSDPRINGDPDAVVLVVPAPDRGRAGNGSYDHNIGVWYVPGKNKWAIFNQDLAAVPAGSTFEVTVPQADEGFVHRAGPTDTFDNVTYLDNRSIKSGPDAALSVTQNWNPGGGAGVYNDHPVGVSYDEEVGKWFVYNEDAVRMPEGAAFNVAVSGAAEPAG